MGLRRRLIKFRAQLRYMPWAMRLVWTAAARWTVSWLVLLVLQGLLPVVTIFLGRSLVNNLVAVLGQGGGWEALRPSIILVALIAAVMLILEVLRSVTMLVQTAQAEHVEHYVSDLIHRKALSLDLGFYESPDSYDRLYRARTDALSRPVALVENLGSVLQNGLLLIAMAGVLFTFGFWLPLLLLVSALPSLWIVLQSTMRLNQWRLRITAARRRTNYFSWILTLREAAAELRLFALGEQFRKEYLRLQTRLRSERIGLARRQALGETLAGSLALVMLACALGWMAWRAVHQQATLGDLALFYTAFSQGQRLVRTLLASVNQIYSNTLFLENLHEFLQLQPEILEPAQPLPLPALSEGIRFDGVRFRYPGSERVALDDFNINLPAGKIIAIVGENGAGKSTLLKLLCRFYDPEQGSITWDGHDLRDLSPAELQRSITVLFQEPVHYHETASRNIAYGAWDTHPDAEAIQVAAESAGAHEPIMRLPDGYATIMGRWFGGAEMSVGEWQRIALARAFLRPATLVILDEPTSAMDSWAENDWLARFRRLVQGRTTVIITHRFTTAMQADVIHVMVEGRSVESGTHAELLRLNGRYATSWLQQMRESGVEDSLEHR